MATRVIGVIDPSQHARQLGHSILPVYDGRLGHRAATLIPFADHNLGPSAGRNLGQVGDAEYLGVPRKCGQGSPHRGAGLAANARINLVEH